MCTLRCNHLNAIIKNYLQELFTPYFYCRRITASTSLQAECD